MKKTCNGCRALDNYKCSLGKKTEIKYINNPYGLPIKESVPLEDCHKPRNYANFFYLKNLQNKQQ